MTSTSGPKRSKGSSKKNKKSWRKNTDIDDVIEFLDDQRLEQRLGGPFDDRADQDLFVVDKGQSQSAHEEVSNRRALRKRKAAEEPLRCHQILLPEVPHQSHQRPRRNPVLVAKEETLAKSGILKSKQKMAKKHRLDAAKLRKATAMERSTRRRTEFDFDLWDKEENGVVKTIKSNEWLEGSTKTHTLKGLQKKTAKVPKGSKATATRVASVEVPKGGESYNPSLKDHQELLWEATLVELKKEKAERNLDFHTTDMFPKKAPTEQDQLKELAEGLFEEEDEEEEVKEEDELEPKKKGNKAKTKSQKRKEKARKFREMKALRRKKERLTEHEVLRLKSIKKQLQVEEATVAKKQSIKQEKRAERLLRPGMLSRHKFEEQDLDLKLSEELTGNLRTLKPEGSILVDRFKSLQKRNIIETRLKQKVKRSKKKKIVERRIHKMGFEWEK